MKVIGVDPAPTKGMAVFGGMDRHVPVEQSRAFVNELNTVPDLLICWDSPLTGPPGSVVGGAEADGSAFSQRPIESFFSRARGGFKTPRGISVRGYSGCPYWAMSRSLIGLPRTGPFDEGTLPFRLVTDESQRPVCGRSVVEVHPALALWLWCRDEREADASWDYKRDDSVREDVWKKIFQVPAVSKVLSATCPTAPSSDDELDARVAYALGRLWLENPRSVILLGDMDKGTFLVPKVQGLEAAFRSFSQKLPNKLRILVARSRDNTPLQPTASGGG